MSHYDSDREHEAEQYRKRQAKRCRDLLHDLTKVSVRVREIAPTRFHDALDDLENWLKVHGRDE